MYSVEEDTITKQWWVIWGTFRVGQPFWTKEAAETARKECSNTGEQNGDSEAEEKATGTYGA